MTTSRADVAAAEQALERLFRLTGGRKMYDRQSAAVGVLVSRAGYAILRTLDQDGPLSTGDLARSCTMDPGAAVRQVNALEEDGLVGRTSHAGAPWLGINAVHKAMGVVEGIRTLATSLPGHPFLDRSTIAVTHIESAPSGASRIPDRTTVAIDRRFLPAESPDAVVWQVQSIVNQLAAGDNEFKGEVHVRQAAVTAYTGVIVWAD